MRIKVIFISSFLFLASNISFSQSTNNFWERVSLRKSFQSKNDKAEAAVITFTNPEAGSSSYLVNAAIGYDLFSGQQNAVISLSPYLEFHRNTLVDKEQHLLQTGLAFEWQTSNLVKRNASPIIISTAKYSNNYEKEIESFQADAAVTLILKGKRRDLKNFWVPNNQVDILKSKKWGFMYTPYIGTETELRVKTEDSAEQGNIQRVLGRVKGGFYFLSKHDTKGVFEFYRVELLGDYSYRYDFINSTEDSDLSSTYFVASLNYLIFKNSEKKDEIKIGLKYVDGENPSKGFEDQNYLALKPRS